MQNSTKKRALCQVYNHALFEANAKLGDAGNEGEKARRLEVALQTIAEDLRTVDPPNLNRLRSIIKAAQG